VTSSAPQHGLAKGNIRGSGKIWDHIITGTIMNAVLAAILPARAAPSCCGSQSRQKLNKSGGVSPFVAPKKWIVAREDGQTVDLRCKARARLD